MEALARRCEAHLEKWAHTQEKKALCFFLRTYLWAPEPSLSPTHALPEADDRAEPGFDTCAPLFNWAIWYSAQIRAAPPLPVTCHKDWAIAWNNNSPPYFVKLSYSIIPIPIQNEPPSKTKIFFDFELFEVSQVLADFAHFTVIESLSHSLVLLSYPIPFLIKPS